MGIVGSAEDDVVAADMDDRAFEIDSLDESGVTVVTVSGEVDIVAGSPLEEALAGAGEHLVVDLSGVTFMDSTGINALLHAQRRHGQVAIVCPPSQHVRRLLELTGAGRVVKLYASREEAVAAIAPR